MLTTPPTPHRPPIAAPPASGTPAPDATAPIAGSGAAVAQPADGGRVEILDAGATLTPVVEAPSVESPAGLAHRFDFVAERLWLDFVNTDWGRNGSGVDVLLDFSTFVDWLTAADALDGERAAGVRRRADQQPAGAAAALLDARRVRASLRALAEWGATAERSRLDALGEINRVLGRSMGTRRIEWRSEPGGGFVRSFVPAGDAFAGLLIPVVESAADALVLDELARVRRCADPRCPRVFFDATKNGRRRWCDMATCGNRAKAARHRARQRAEGAKPRADS